MSTTNTLFEQVKNANRIVKRIFGIIDEMQQINETHTIATNKIKQLSSIKIIIRMVLFCFIVIPIGLYLLEAILASLLWSGLIELGIIQDNENILWVCFIIVYVIISIISFILFNRRRKSKIKKYHNSIVDCEKKYQEKDIELSKIAESNKDNLEIIPVKYRYPLATDYIEEVFESGRATTIPQALDKFEEQLHRWKLENSMNQYLEIQQIQMENLEKMIIDVLIWS